MSKEITWLLMAKVKAFPLTAHLHHHCVRAVQVKRLGDDMRELRAKSGEELRPFFGRTLTLSPSAASGMASVLNRELNGEMQEEE